MKTRMLWLICCMVALSSQAQTTKRSLWVWKDASGVTHYSDKPEPGAKRMEIVGTTPIVPSSPPSPVQATPPGPPQREYTLLEFTAPDKDASFFGPDTEVTVELRSEPGLMGGDELTLYLDGNRVEDSNNAFSYTFRNLARGSHTVNAVIRDADGVEKIRSMSRSFSIQQTTINNPRNVGPALKPKPTPTPAPAPAPAPKPPPPGK
jgi:hypothetical protein